MDDRQATAAGTAAGPRLLFYIGSLRSGGAERQLTQIVRGLADRGWPIAVVTMFPGGKHWDRMRHWPDVQLRALYGAKAGIKPGVAWQLTRAPTALRRQVKFWRPDVVYSLLYMSNLHARLALGAGRAGRLVWGIRASDNRLPWFRTLARRWGRDLSSAVGTIVFNSNAGRRFHERRGFQARRHVVIPNGFATDRFRPDADAGRRLRSEWGIGETQPLIGLVGRLTAVKDHPTFLAAARRVVQSRPDARFVCVGGGRTVYTRRLERLARELDLDDCLIWAGERTNMPAVYNALDLAVSSSVSEGFPNVVGEALACGVGCVVTDVGDSARLVGATGAVVPPHDPGLLADGILAQLAAGRPDPQSLHRQIVRTYSVAAMIEKTAALLREVAS